LDGQEFSRLLRPAAQRIFEELNGALAFNAMALNDVLEDIFVFLNYCLAILLAVSELLISVSLNPLQ
jgi:hypothetical protein